MLMIDAAILNTNRVICKNISRFDSSERGLLSQNILAQLRNLIEYIAGKVYAGGHDIDPNDYQTKAKALGHLKSRGDLRFLNKFHDLLQMSVSHYKRLMLKYYEYLLKTKIFLKEAYRLDILENIECFPLDTDTELSEYYEKIADRISRPRYNSLHSTYNDRYYIQKIKPFFVAQHIFYEVTFSPASVQSNLKRWI